MVDIVTVNVSQQLAPRPSALQRSGAILSQGATTLAPGGYGLLTQPSDLTSILMGALAITSITQTTGTATATTTAPHGFTVADVIWLTISGALPAAYNGTFQCTITGASTFTYAVPSGTSTPSTGTKVYTNADVAELSAQVTTFFGQGRSTAVWVLELGADSATDGTAFLNNWITQNPGIFYSYLISRTWDANAAFLAFLAQFENTTAKTYFFVTTTLRNYNRYTTLMKCVLTMIESPALGVYPRSTITACAFNVTPGQGSITTAAAHGILPGEWFQVSNVDVSPSIYDGWYLAGLGTTGSTILFAVPQVGPNFSSTGGFVLANAYENDGVPVNEFSHASDFYVALHNDPSPVNKVPPFNFSYIFGVTPFPTQSNASLLATLRAANISIVGTGAAGGISNTILVGGNTMDGQPFNYWYSVDWMQINVALFLTNAVINGSNTPANPLYLDQAGINTLQGVIARTALSAVNFGLALGQVIQTQLTAAQLQQVLADRTYAGNVLINAVPFSSYYSLAESDYPIGKYAGFTIVYTPQRGFQQIVVNIIVTDFVAA